MIQKRTSVAVWNYSGEIAAKKIRQFGKGIMKVFHISILTVVAQVCTEMYT